MSKIIAIGTALPAYRHEQLNILQFMQSVYALNESGKRKLRYLYQHSGIDQRYSVISDYSQPIHEWKFYPQTENLDPFPALEQRISWFNQFAAPLSVEAIRACLGNQWNSADITHLISVSCTGLSAPGLELQIMDHMDLPKSIFRTSVNFMGCYACIHALKLADAICRSEKGARVMIVCTELCTLHFQREPTQDNIASGLLFGDGAAAVLVTDDTEKSSGFHLNSFYAEVATKGREHMSWELSSSGFLMTLSGDVPDLIQEDFDHFVHRALAKAGVKKESIQHWCMHPGGKRILEAIHKSLQLQNGELDHSYKVLRQFGNMSSATILFVMKNMMDELKQKNPKEGEKLFAAAFGPGLTLETFLATYN